MIPEPETIDIVRGQDLDVIITVIDHCDGQPVDLTAYTCHFGIAESQKSEYIHMAPVTWAGNEITAQLDDSFTETLTKKKYYFSCWIEYSGNITPVARGPVSVDDDPRNH